MRSSGLFILLAFLFATANWGFAAQEITPDPRRERTQELSPGKAREAEPGMSRWARQGLAGEQEITTAPPKETPEGPAMDLRTCDPYGSPLMQSGWSLPAPRAPSELPPLDLAYILDAAWAGSPPSIDGSLDDPAWRKALLSVDGLRYYDTNEQEPDRARTSVMFMYDRDALYVGVTCHDARLPDPLVSPDEARRLLADDSVIVTLDPEADLDDPLNLRFYRIRALSEDRASSAGAERAEERYPPWRYAVGIEKGRWTVEMRLDWWGLEPTPNFRKAWLVNLAHIRNARDPHGPWTPFSPGEPGAGPAEEYRSKDPFERNSAWAPIGEMEGWAKGKMPRLRIDFDFSVYLWAARQIRSGPLPGKALYECSALLTNRTNSLQQAIVRVTAQTGKWREIHAEKETVVERNEEQRVDLTYALDTPGPHGLSLAVVDKKTGRVLRRSANYQVGDAAPLAELRLRRARNERSHASFTLTARRDLKDVRIEPGDLIGKNAIVFGKRIAVRSVESTLEPRGWRIDTGGRRAFVPLGEYQPDLLTPRVEPFDLPQGQGRQIWLTVDRDDLPPGKYEGKVRISAQETPPIEIPFILEAAEARIEPERRPFAGVWGGWEDSSSPSGAAAAFRGLEINSVRMALEANALGGFEWNMMNDFLLDAANEKGMEIAIALPASPFSFADTTRRLVQLLADKHAGAPKVPMSFVMPGKPYGGGLNAAYVALRKECPWARLACVVPSLDDGLKMSTGLLDDWYLGAGALGEAGAGGALKQVMSDELWRAFINSHAKTHRFIVLHTPSNDLPAGEAARNLRLAFWLACKNGLTGVALRPSGQEGLWAAPTRKGSRPVWLDTTETTGPARLSLPIEALSDGAEDYALIGALAGRVQKLKDAAKLSRGERKEL